MAEEPIMDEMEETTLLNNYKEWVDTGKIQFLAKRGQQRDVMKCITDLLRTIDKLKRRETDNKDKNQEHGEGEEWYEAHENGRKLWEVLAKYALRNIEPTSKGNSTLYDFLNASTKFEDILYGLESHYRDHTLHSLWVYLIGEYILREKLKGTGIHKKLYWYLYNDISNDADKISIPEVLVNYSKIKAIILAKVVTRYTDAIWCIIALCHDLGYSLEKLSILNDRVKEVLKYFDITNLEHTGYSLDIEHQYLVSQCLELMAADVRIVPGENYDEIKDEKYKGLNTRLKRIAGTSYGEKINKEIERQIVKRSSNTLIKLDTTEIIKRVARLTSDEEFVQIKKLEEKTLVKCYRDDSAYWRLCRALEKKQHGILSSYLIYKILGIFADATVRGSAEEWGLDDNEAVENIIRGDILFAVAQHEFDFAHIFEFSSLADVLVLADELEEFSRYGRPLSSRAYHPTLATSNVELIPKGKGITIKISYYVKKDHSLISFFIRKAERLCRIYSLGERDETTGPYRIKQIIITAKKDEPDNLLELRIELNKDWDNSKVQLPKYDSSGTGPKRDTKDYTVSLYDDKIRIIDKKIDKKDKKSPEGNLLSEWFKKLSEHNLSKEWQPEVDKYMILWNQSKEKT